jgi:hypothetical protein
MKNALVGILVAIGLGSFVLIFAAENGVPASLPTDNDAPAHRIGASPTPLSPPSTDTIDGQSVAVGNWHAECVDCPKWFQDLGEHSLRLDDQGHPHIAYGGYNLYYAWYDGTAWRYETVDTAPYVGAYAALALDTAGNPHIAYYDAQRADLKYARYTGTAWVIETVQSEWDAGKKAALELDPTDQPHIAYAEILPDLDQGIKYAHRDGTGWQLQSVYAHGYVDDLSLALDQAGHPHIGFTSVSLVRYATLEGGTWSTEIVADLRSSYAGYVSLALDSADRPRITFTVVTGDYRGTGTAYATRDNAEWQVESIPPELYRCSSLTFDAQDRPHCIATAAASGEQLLHAWHDGVKWQSEIVEELIAYGIYASLALDPNTGQPSASYLNVHDGASLKYGRREATGWTMQTVDRRGEAGPSNALQMDRQTGSLHAAFGDSDAGALRYAWRDAGGWRVETVGSREDADGWWWVWSVDVAVGQDGRPHIAWVQQLLKEQTSDYVLRYTHYDGVAWHTDTITTASHIEAVSLALDSTDLPQLIFRSQYQLYYTWLDGVEWQVSTVDNTDGETASLLLDNDDRPHVLYTYLYTSPHLVYGRLEAGGWLTETVDSADAGRFGHALALDSGGRPHAVYTDATGRLLKYARRNGDGWHVEIVDRTAGVGRTGLVLDLSDHPYIVYHDRDRGVKYAWYDGQIWHTELIVGLDFDEDFVFEAIGFTLDLEGRPHVTYHNPADHGLYHAFRVPRPALSKTAAPAQGLRNGDLLTFTLTVTGPGLDLRFWDPLPATLRYVSGSLTTTLDPAPVYSATAHAVLWQGRPPTGTAGLVQFQVTPGLTGSDSLSLALPVANTAWLTDALSGVGTWATAFVNGWRIYLPALVQRR